MASRKWWHSCGSVLRFMPGEDHHSIDDIISMLDWVKDTGFGAIHITAPYDSAGFYPWWGLRPYNYFGINKNLGGGMGDFRRLVLACHDRGLKVIVFINIGYCDINSPLWKKACSDRRSGQETLESSIFFWGDDPMSPAPFSPQAPFLTHGRWVYCDEAGCFYWCQWQENGIYEPQYNYGSPHFRAYAKEILKYWLSSGIDGVIVDAVNWYADCTMPLMKASVTDIIHSFPDVLCIPEGASGFGDSIWPWITEGGFDVIDDQPFHSDLHWNGSAIMDSVSYGDPQIIEDRLTQCALARSEGAVSWSYLSWGDRWSAEMRLLEAAILVGTGHITEVIPSYISHLTEDQRSVFYRIIKASRHKSLAPIKHRERLFPAFSAPCYACLSDGDVVCAYNLSDSSIDLKIDIGSHFGLHTSAFYDLISGDIFYSDKSELDIKLAPLGFVFLERI